MCAMVCCVIHKVCFIDRGCLTSDSHTHTRNLYIFPLCVLSCANPFFFFCYICKLNPRNAHAAQPPLLYNREYIVEYNALARAPKKFHLISRTCRILKSCVSMCVCVCVCVEANNSDQLINGPHQTQINPITVWSNWTQYIYNNITIYIINVCLHRKMSAIFKQIAKWGSRYFVFCYILCEKQKRDSSAER